MHDIQFLGFTSVVMPMHVYMVSMVAGCFPHIQHPHIYVGKATSRYAGHIHMHRCHNRGESDCKARGLQFKSSILPLLKHTQHINVGKATSRYAGHIHIHRCHNRGESDCKARGLQFKSSILPLLCVFQQR